jgi:hypothetical protein
LRPTGWIPTLIFLRARPTAGFTGLNIDPLLTKPLT